MSNVAPGWYKDPADLTTQRYWDGEGWLGDPIPADAIAPSGPPEVAQPMIAGSNAGPIVAEPVAPPPADALQWRRGPVQPKPVQPSAYRGGSAQSPYPGLTQGATPDQGLATLPLAGPGVRLLARVIDVGLVLILCAVANAWFAYRWWQLMAPYLAEAYRRGMAGDTSTAGLEPPAQAGTLLLVIIFVIAAVWFAYEVPSNANSGQTPGKRVFRIRVVGQESLATTEGIPRLGFARSLRRWSRLGLPTLLWYCYGIGFLLQAIDCMFVVVDRPLRQALHDKAAATVVVSVARRTRRSAPDPSGADPSGVNPPGADQAGAGRSRGGRHVDPR